MKRLVPLFFLVVACSKPASVPTKEETAAVVSSIVSTVTSPGETSERNKAAAEQLATVVQNVINNTTAASSSTTENTAIVPQRDHIAETVVELKKAGNELAQEEMRKFCFKDPAEIKAALEKNNLTVDDEKIARVLEELQKFCATDKAGHATPGPWENKNFNVEFKSGPLNPVSIVFQGFSPPPLISGNLSVSFKDVQFVRDEQGYLYFAMVQSGTSETSQAIAAGVAVSKDHGKNWQLISELTTTLTTEIAKPAEVSVCDKYTDGTTSVGYVHSAVAKTNSADIGLKLLPNPSGKGVVLYRSRERDSPKANFSCPVFRKPDCVAGGTCLNKSEYNILYETDYAFERFTIDGDVVSKKEVISANPYQRVKLLLAAGNIHRLYKYPVHYIKSFIDKKDETIVRDYRNSDFIQACSYGPAAGYKSYTYYTTKLEEEKLYFVEPMREVNATIKSSKGVHEITDPTELGYLKYDVTPTIVTETSEVTRFDSFYGRKYVLNNIANSGHLACRHPFEFSTSKEEVAALSQTSEAAYGYSIDGGNTFTWETSTARTEPRWQINYSSGCNDAAKAKLSDAGLGVGSCVNFALNRTLSINSSTDMLEPGQIAVPAPDWSIYGLNNGTLCKFDRTIKSVNFLSACTPTLVTYGKIRTGSNVQQAAQFDRDGNLHLALLKTSYPYPIYEFIPASKFSPDGAATPTPQVHLFYKGSCDTLCVYAQKFLAAAKITVVPSTGAGAPGALKPAIEHALSVLPMNKSFIAVEHSADNIVIFSLAKNFDRLALAREIKLPFSEFLYTNGNWKSLKAATPENDLKIAVSDIGWPTLVMSDTDGVYSLQYSPSVEKYKDKTTGLSHWHENIAAKPPLPLPPAKLPLTSLSNSLGCGNMDAYFLSEKAPKYLATTNGYKDHCRFLPASTFPTASRNQGLTDACHAFASVGLMESALYRQLGVRLPLSEVHLFLEKTFVDRSFFQNLSEAAAKEYLDFVTKNSTNALNDPIFQGVSPFFNEQNTARADINYILQKGIAAARHNDWYVFENRYREARANETRTLTSLKLVEFTLPAVRLELARLGQNWNDSFFGDWFSPWRLASQQFADDTLEAWLKSAVGQVKNRDGDSGEAARISAVQALAGGATRYAEMKKQAEVLKYAIASSGIAHQHQEWWKCEKVPYVWPADNKPYMLPGCPFVDEETGEKFIVPEDPILPTRYWAKKADSIYYEIKAFNKPKISSYLRDPAKCETFGKDVTRFVRDQLDKGIPVGVAGLLNGLRDWNISLDSRPIMHAFIIDGYYVGLNGKLSFNTRNSWGLTQNHLIHEDEMCHIGWTDILHVPNDTSGELPKRNKTSETLEALGAYPW